MQRSIAANEPVRMRSGRKALQGCKKSSRDKQLCEGRRQPALLFWEPGGSPARVAGGLAGMDGGWGEVVLKKYQKTEENPLLFSKKTCIL